MSRCSYTYTVRKANDVDVLCLEGYGPGMSLTNGMEDVIEELQIQFKKEGKTFPTKVIYKDTGEKWDGWDTKKEEFIHLQFSRMDKALHEITFEK